MFNPQHTTNHIYKEDGKKETIDSLITGKSKDMWLRSLSNDWGRLAQGNIHGVKGTDTIKFISKNNIPSNKNVTYASFIYNFRLLKEEQYRARITVGRDNLEYSYDAGSLAANLLETKIIINSVISDKKGCRIHEYRHKRLFSCNSYERSRVYESKIQVLTSGHQIYIQSRTTQNY